MGFDLYPSFIALMQFGDRWLSVNKRPPLILVHRSCGCESRPIVACSNAHPNSRQERLTIGTAPAPAANLQSRGGTPDAHLTAADSCWGAPVLSRAPSRSSATNGASWSFARLFSVTAVTTRSSRNWASRPTY